MNPSKRLIYLMLFGSCAALVSSCTILGLIKEDPLARYKVSAELTATIMHTLADAREQGFIKNDHDWKKIQLASKTARDAFKVWYESLENGYDDPEVEKLAMVALDALKRYNKIYGKEKD